MRESIAVTLLLSLCACSSAGPREPYSEDGYGDTGESDETETDWTDDLPSEPGGWGDGTCDAPEQTVEVEPFPGQCARCLCGLDLVLIHCTNLYECGTAPGDLDG